MNAYFYTFYRCARFCSGGNENMYILGKFLEQYWLKGLLLFCMPAIISMILDFTIID